MMTMGGSAQEISGWTCGPFYGGASGNESVCVKSTNGTNVIKAIGSADAQTLANFGEQFVSAGGAADGAALAIRRPPCRNYAREEK